MKTILPFSQLFLLGCGVLFAQSLFAQWNVNSANNIYYTTNSGRSVGIGTGNVSLGNRKLVVETSGDVHIGLAHVREEVNLVTWLESTDAQIGTMTDHPLGFFTDGGSPQMTLLTNGNVGIGTQTPARLLHLFADNNSVTGSSQLFLQQTGSGDAYMSFRVNNGTNARYYHVGIDNSDNDRFKIGTSSSANSGVHSATSISIATNGNVGIGPGVSNADLSTYRLNVQGVIRSEEIRVETDWADFVFGDNFRLRPLIEVEKFIRKHRHLPDVTPAADIQKEGLQVAKQMTEMMQKIEELTLYILELNKRLEQLETENTALKNK